MHIGLLTSDLTTKNGWGTYSLSIIDSLRRQGHQLTIVTAEDSHLHPDKAIQTYRLLPAVTPPGSLFILRLLLQTQSVRRVMASCDVVHSTVELYAPLGHIVAGERPHIITGHGTYMRYPQFRSGLVSWLYERVYNAATIVTVSDYTGRVAQQIAPHANVQVIHNAIDATLFSDMPRQPTDVPTVVTLGGVKARKGTLELVEAIAVVRESLPDVQCIVMGSTTAESNYTTRVKAQIAHLGLEDHVHLLGFVDDTTVRAWYSQAHVFALPSMNVGWKFEGFGLATLEASAAGLPVIGTTDCGAEDAIDDGLTGLLVSQDNIKTALPDALLRLLTDPALAKEMGTAGRKKAQGYTWDDVGTRLTDLYSLLLDESTQGNTEVAP